MVAVPSRGRADLQAHAPEADAVQVLYEQYGRQIYAFCFSRLRSREEAEDAVQSTFLNAFRALQRDVAPSHEAAWLYKIAENVCLTRARSSVRRRRVETPGDLEAISEVVPAHEPDTEELTNLPQALESMPEQQRRALLLREWQGLSYREIAEEMELSQSAVETLLFRARRTLAAGLADEPKRSGKLARLRASGDAGAIVSLLKTLLFSGGAKVVMVGAVAASGVVGVSPGARHTIDDLLVPHMKAAPHHVAPAKPKATPHVAPSAAVTPPPAVAAPPVVVHHTVAPPVHKAKTKAHPHHAVVRHATPKPHLVPPPERSATPVAPPPATVQSVTPAAPLPPTPAPDDTQQSQDAQPQPKPKPQQHAPQQPAAPAADHGRGKGHAQTREQGRDHGHGHGRGHDPSSAQPAPPAPVVPPVAVPPVVAPTPEPAPDTPQPGESDNSDGGDRGNDRDHVRGDDHGHGHDGHGGGHGNR